MIYGFAFLKNVLAAALIAWGCHGCADGADVYAFAILAGVFMITDVREWSS